MKKGIQLTCFLIILAASLGLPWLDLPLSSNIVIALVTIPAAVFLQRTNKKLFVPALFFVINAFTAPTTIAILEFSDLHVPQLFLLPGIGAYLFVIVGSRQFRPHIHWMKAGRFNRTVLILTAGLIGLSSLTLLGWAVWIVEDLSRYTEFIPRIPLPLLILYGLFFPLLNSLFEEFISRAVLYDGFAALWSRSAPVILAQAAVFAAWHYEGFPGGAAGVILVFAWSVVLGIIRHKAGGMMPVLAAHYAADLTIAILLFFMLILPGRLWL